MLWHYTPKILPYYAQIPAIQLDELIRSELDKVEDKTALTAFLFSRMSVFNINLMKQSQIIQEQQAKIQELQAQINSLKK